MPQVLSVIIPCYNEEKTLERCLKRVSDVPFEGLDLEFVVIDDCSKDKSLQVANALAAKDKRIKVCRHEVNQGKGAALHTGFRHATGDFVVVQDADLEYDPNDLIRIAKPLQDGMADVVFGSRFLSSGCHRVLYYWHSMGNRFLTAMSNMLTDLNLTDMETCYKMFRREIIQGMELKEKRFGFEPEVVAKVAQLRVRVFEIGISYFGRTYEEGKKIGAKDGFRALYCILKYNLPKAPAPIQFLFYLFIGGASAVINLILFLMLQNSGIETVPAALTAFVVAAVVNYLLSIALLFRKNARWGSAAEYLAYAAVVAAIAAFDSFTTKGLIMAGSTPAMAKATASLAGLILNFLGRKFVVFYEKPNPDWKPQVTE